MKNGIRLFPSSGFRISTWRHSYCASFVGDSDVIEETLGEGWQ